jgi:isopenicillin N synthase-like dioxygenase
MERFLRAFIFYLLHTPAFHACFNIILTMTDKNQKNAIPVIDLSQADHSRLISQIGAACREFGFFGVVNHGIPNNIIDGAFDVSKAFFDLPQETKLALHINQSSTHRGFDPIGWQSLDLSKEGDAQAADLKESFYIGTEPAPNANPIVPNHGENQWPSAESLPEFDTKVNLYRAQAKQLAYRLLSLIAESLGMKETALDGYAKYPTCTTRLLYYPPQPESSMQQIGSGAHTDWGAVTILAQDDAGGLEVRLAGGQWIDIEPQDGMLVINTGDLIQRWTNDLYRSSWHRVINKHAGRARYSIAYFFDLDHFAKIDTLPVCIDDKHPAKYPSITAGDHILEMYRRTTLA